MAEDLDYVPMPDNVVADIEKMWAAEIKDASGKPLYRADALKAPRRRPFLSPPQGGYVRRAAARVALGSRCQ